MHSLIFLALGLTVAGPLVARAGQLHSNQLAGARPASSGQVVIADAAALCETAVATAEYAAGLPARLLRAISLTESGQFDPVSGRLRSWPWTINAEGEGRFFKTRQDAVTAVKGLQARGVRSIDVGCLQVNLMYHPDAFASLDEAFDPGANARYAARLLNVLYAETRVGASKGRDSKGWAHAIAAYHSETPALGEPYCALVMARWRNSDAGAPPPMEPLSGSAYRDFGHDAGVYGAFAPRSLVYRAFAPR